MMMDEQSRISGVESTLDFVKTFTGSLHIKKSFAVLYIITPNSFDEIKILGLIVICDWVLFFKKEETIVSAIA